MSEETWAIIGDGNQGCSHALNRRNTGLVDVVAGNHEDRSWGMVKQDPQRAIPWTKRANVALLPLPNEIVTERYEESIERGYRSVTPSQSPQDSWSRRTSSPPSPTSA